MSKPRLFNLCCGGGVMDYPIRDRIESVGGIEIRPEIGEWYERNIGVKPIAGSVSAVGLNGLALPEADWIHGSFPCQSFSKGNTIHRTKESIDDFRIALGAAAIFKRYKPSIVTLENVPDYLNSESCGYVLSCLTELGYRLWYRSVDLSKYGVPQTRDRLIVVARRDGGLIYDPVPQEIKGWYSRIADLIPSLKPTKVSDWHLRGTEEGSLRRSILSSVQRGEAHAPLLVNLMDTGRRITIRQAHEPAFTQTRNMLRRPSTCPGVVVDGRVVAANARCMARWQLLDDTYQIPDESKSAGRILASEIIGNGAPIGALLMEMLGL